MVVVFGKAHDDGRLATNVLINYSSGVPLGTW